MSLIHLTAQQEQAKGIALARLHSLRQHCRIGGFAGTGKTTLISSIVAELERLGSKVAVMAPTGKAANVLCQKCVPASTIHRRLYELIEVKPIQFRLRDTVEVDFFIIDESSMIATDLYNDILTFNKPTLFIGDPAQLEPVGDDAKLMHKPDFVLTQIHRTAEESGIIHFATALRTTVIHPTVYARNFGGSLAPGTGVSFKSYAEVKKADWLGFDQIIVGKNLTRHKLNQAFKKSLTSLPVIGDKLICLKNDYAHGVFNGETFIVTNDELEQDDQTGELCIELESYDGTRNWYPFWLEYFDDQTLEPWRKAREVIWLDYAYAITCHKSQGSEWDNVGVLDEAFGNPPNRWRYTAATRAAKTLTWIK